MGNCQAVDAAALVIQHPSGRIERLYWPVTASEVMRTNPGHYVSLIIPLPSPPQPPEEDAEKICHQDKRSVRFTRVKLLRPSETLALGHAYRLVTSQEVMKVLKAKKYAKTKEHRAPELAVEQTVEGNHGIDNGEGYQKPESSDVRKEKKTDHQEARQGRHGQRAAPTNEAVSRPKSWRPTLQSIAEGGS